MELPATENNACQINLIFYKVKAFILSNTINGSLHFLSGDDELSDPAPETNGLSAEKKFDKIYLNGKTLVGKG